MMAVKLKPPRLPRPPRPPKPRLLRLKLAGRPLEPVLVPEPVLLRGRLGSLGVLVTPAARRLFLTSAMAEFTEPEIAALMLSVRAWVPKASIALVSYVVAWKALQNV